MRGQVLSWCQVFTILGPFFQWLHILLVVNSEGLNQSFCQAIATHNSRFFAHLTNTHGVTFFGDCVGFATNCRAHCLILFYLFIIIGCASLVTSCGQSLQKWLQKFRCSSIESRRWKYDRVD